MREDYLHYLWKFQKLNRQEIKTAEGLPVKVISPGTHNLLSGPDFFNSRLLIGEQEWAGNVEIHLRSSDWYMHGHENDPAYDNVILHVVWEHDVEVFQKNNVALPVVEIRDLVAPDALNSYQDLCAGTALRWINCENDLAQVDDFLLENWLERLFIERLEQKSLLVKDIFERVAGDWEVVLFNMLAKNFGLNVNGEAFLSIAASIPFAVVRKTRGNLLQLEALFLGQAGLLEKPSQEVYYQLLKQEYNYLRKKFNLKNEGVLPVKYFRLRPDNFPEIRLVQLAAVYHANATLFSKLNKSNRAQEVYRVFEVKVSDFWNTHYTFSKDHSFRRKKLSKKFLDLQIINTVVPVKFSYLQSVGKEDFEGILNLLRELPVEENQVISRFKAIKVNLAVNAHQSQALLQLKREYCEKNACLNCAIGLKILQKEHQF